MCAPLRVAYLRVVPNFGGAARELLSFTVVPVSPSHPDAERMLWVYFDDLVARYQGRPATEEEIRESVLEAPSDDLAAPTGLLLLGRLGSNPVGCVGLRFLPDGVGQLTRMFVMASQRPRASVRGSSMSLKRSHATGE